MSKGDDRMQDEKTKASNENGENFAEMLEQYNAEGVENINVGDQVKGKIIDITDSSVFIDVGAKHDGVAEKEELLDEEGSLSYQVGDEIELYAVAINKAEIRLSKAVSGVGGLNMLQDAFENKLPVKGRVREVCKGGLVVDMLQRRAFCPVSQIDARYVENPEEYVGEEYDFLITTLEENGRNIVVSRRKLIEREREEAVAEFLQNHKEGDVVEAKVVRLTNFGAFVEPAPFIEGLVHISELSLSRINKPDEAVSVGDRIRVKILKIGTDKKTGRLKMDFSRKELMDDPWNSVKEQFKAGDKVKGKVVNLADFGAFVEIAPGLEGLVHIGEMSYKQRVNKPGEIVSKGDEVFVMIKEIDTEKQRISLSLRDAEGDPWLEVEEKYKASQQVTGTIEKKERFGYFIHVEPGIVGLLPKSKIASASDPTELEKLNPGDSVTLIVESVRPNERKMTLAPVSTSEEAREDWRGYSQSDQGSMGILGAKLQEAMKKKS